MGCDAYDGSDGRTNGRDQVKWIEANTSTLKQEVPFFRGPAICYDSEQAAFHGIMTGRVRPRIVAAAHRLSIAQT